MPGIKILDVDKTLHEAGKSNNYIESESESEIIVDGNGIFTHSLDKSGFYEIKNTNGVRTFEIIYEPLKPHIEKKTANEIFNSFITNEYNLINSMTNLKDLYEITHKNIIVNDKIFEEVWERIKKEKKGGRRTKRRYFSKK
jgi:hypothetical protein